MKFIKSIGLCIALILLASVLVADYQNTAYQTDISSDQSSLVYQIGSTSKTVRSATISDVSVMKNGGIKLLNPSWQVSNTIIAGAGYQYNFSVANSGNFTETINNALLEPAGGFTTTWEKKLSEASLNISREGISSLVTLFVTADAQANDGETGSFKLNVNATAGGNYGQYQGKNGYQYGSAQEISQVLNFVVSAPSITIQKSVEIIAPQEYVNNGGGANDPVPGATLKYTINYANTGSAKAKSVTIVDNIPADTEYLSADGGTGKEYNYGSGFVATLPDDSPVDPDVQAVKWSLGDLDAGARGQVILEVVIK